MFGQVCYYDIFPNVVSAWNCRSWIYNYKEWFKLSREGWSLYHFERNWWEVVCQVGTGWSVYMHSNFIIWLYILIWPWLGIYVSGIVATVFGSTGFLGRYVVQQLGMLVWHQSLCHDIFVHAQLCIGGYSLLLIFGDLCMCENIFAVPVTCVWTFDVSPMCVQSSLFLPGKLFLY